MNNILLIEEDEALAEKLKSEFEANSINVFFCKDRESAEFYINDSHQFDAVILDWFFENPEDSTISKLILKKLNKTHFRPVFIYTNNKPNFEQTPPEEIDFPQNLISCHSKDTGFKELMGRIDELLRGNITLQLADTYRKSIFRTFENILFELNSMQNVDLSKILNRIYGNGENIDWSSDVILNLLHRALINDDHFVENISDLLKRNNPTKSTPNSDESKKIANRLIYYHSKSNIIKTGDIVSISNRSNRIISYGIVVTPDCDLEMLKTKFLEIIELEYLTSGKFGFTADQVSAIKRFQNDSFFFLPSILISNTLTDFVAVLKSKLIVQEHSETSNPKYPSARKRFLYNSIHAYKDVKVNLKLICSISNPYKAEFLQKLHTNDSRVGIPDIKDLFS
jgi:hypothetical protein